MFYIYAKQMIKWTQSLGQRSAGNGANSLSYNTTTTTTTK